MNGITFIQFNSPLYNIPHVSLVMICTYGSQKHIWPHTSIEEISMSQRKKDIGMKRSCWQTGYTKRCMANFSVASNENFIKMIFLFQWTVFPRTGVKYIHCLQTGIKITTCLCTGVMQFCTNKANLRDFIAATGLVILLKLDSNRRFFSLCDLEIWWMTQKNDRALLLCYSKLFASFRSHWWIELQSENA